MNKLNLFAVSPIFSWSLIWYFKVNQSSASVFTISVCHCAAWRNMIYKLMDLRKFEKCDYILNNLKIYLNVLKNLKLNNTIRRFVKCEKFQIIYLLASWVIILTIWFWDRMKIEMKISFSKIWERNFSDDTYVAFCMEIYNGNLV